MSKPFDGARHWLPRAPLALVPADVEVDQSPQHNNQEMASADSVVAQPQHGNTGAPPSSAAECKTEEELAAWRKEEVNTAKKFVPKMFKAPTLQNIEQDYNTNMQRIKAELQHTPVVEETSAAEEEASQLEEYEVDVDFLDEDEEEVFEEEYLQATFDKKEDAQNDNKVKEEEKRLEENLEMEKIAAVDDQPQELDGQKLEAKADCSTAGQPRHGNTSAPPSSAAECKTEEELAAWRKEEVIIAKKFAPKMFQATTLKNIEEDYQSNLQRIKAEQHHDQGEQETKVTKTGKDNYNVQEKNIVAETVKAESVVPDQTSALEVEPAAATVEIGTEQREPPTVLDELKAREITESEHVEGHELEGAKMADAEKEDAPGLEKTSKGDAEDEGALRAGEPQSARQEQEEAPSLKEYKVAGVDREEVALDDDPPSNMKKQEAPTSKDARAKETAPGEEGQEGQKPAESAYKRMLDLFAQQERQQKLEPLESARSSRRSSRSSRSTSTSSSASSSSSGDELEKSGSKDEAPQSPPHILIQACSPQKRPLCTEVSARRSGSAPSSSRCSSASSTPGPGGIDVDGPAARRLVQDFLELLTKSSDNCGQAWLRHMDKRKTGLVKFRDFCAALAKIKMQGDVMMLWHALMTPLIQQAEGHAIRGLSMEAVDPHSAAKIKECGEWFKRRFPQGGLFEAFAMLDVSGTGSVGQVQLCKRLRKLGLFADRPNEGSPAPVYPSEVEFLEELMPLLDISCHGSILAQDFFILEPSHELRKQLLVRLEGSRARNSKGVAPAGDVAALQRVSAMEAQQQQSARSARSASAREPLPLSAQPTQQNSAASMLANLAKASGQLGGKHWKQSGPVVAELIHPPPEKLLAKQQQRQGQVGKGGRAAAASKRKPPLPPSSPLETPASPTARDEVQASSDEQPPTKSPVRQLSPSASSPALPPLNVGSSRKAPSRFSAPSAPVRGSSSLPDLRRGPEPVRLTADQEAAAIRLVAIEAASAAEVAEAAVQAKKLKKKVKCLYGQKQFEKKVEAGFLPALPKSLPAARAAHVAVPLWQDRQQRRRQIRTGPSKAPGAREAFFARGSDQNLFERYYEAEMPVT